jgi:hypothetical protein
MTKSINLVGAPFGVHRPQFGDSHERKRKTGQEPELAEAVE